MQHPSRIFWSWPYNNRATTDLLYEWFMCSPALTILSTMYRTLVRSWYLLGCWGTVLAVTREADGILWSNRAALGPLSPARLWAAGTREPVWVSLDWKSCCSNTLSLAAGHKAQTQKERGREGWERERKENKGEKKQRHWWKLGGGGEWIEVGWTRKKERKKDVNKEGKKHQRRGEGGGEMEA